MAHDCLLMTALLVLLGPAVWWDVRTQRIPNVIIVTTIAAGISMSVMPSGVGLHSAVGGAAAGLILMMPFYLIRIMGAGDVKLMAAAGCVVGFPEVLGSVLITLAVGGALALVWARFTVGAVTVAKNVGAGLALAILSVVTKRLPNGDDFPVSRPRMPYAVAVALGTLGYAAYSRGYMSLFI